MCLKCFAKRWALAQRNPQSRAGRARKMICAAVICLVTAGVARAQDGAPAPNTILDRAAASAQDLYQRHEFAKAAAVIQEVRKQDPDVILVPGWPNTLYN